MSLVTAFLLIWSVFATASALIAVAALRILIRDGTKIMRNALRDVLPDLPPAQRARIEAILDKGLT